MKIADNITPSFKNAGPFFTLRFRASLILPIFSIHRFPLLRHRLLKEELQGFPGAATQIGKKIPVIEKIPPQDLRNAEDEMPVGNLLEHVGTEPFPEFHHPLLMAGGTEMTALVPPRRDFRFASTQRPEDIRGGHPGTSPGQGRGAGPRIPGSGQ